jgi:hypothetical protein
VLNEFRGLYIPGSKTTSKCCINLISHWHLNIDIKEISKSISKKYLVLEKKRTDQISINLGKGFAPIVEFNGLALHNALKNKDLIAFKVATYHYKKYEQKRFLK